MNEKDQPDSDLIAEACEWVAALSMSDVNQLESRRFQAWHNKSPEHAAAYRETRAAFDHPSIAAAMAQVAHEIPSVNTHPLGKSSIRTSAPWFSRARGMRSRFAVGALAASVLVVMISVSLLRVTPSGPTPSQIVTAEYATAGVDTREIPLADGSVATLGARSSVSVDFTAEERSVTLLEGEGYFAVASDSSRPFVVYAGDTIVRAIGTSFDVRLAVDSVRVDVVEGTVRFQTLVRPKSISNVPNQPPTAITASAGERLIFEPENGLTKRPIAPNAELAVWRKGRLEYYREELSRIVADANRYYDGDIKITSDEIKTLKVDASFPASSIDNIFELLAQQVPISVSKTDQGDILLSAGE